MKVSRRRSHLALSAVALSLIFLTLSGQSASNQTTRTIRIVVPFPAGGSADILARLLGEQISKANGPTVVIENRPGGGASIAYDAVARAATDGDVDGRSPVARPLESVTFARSIANFVVAPAAG